MNFPSSVLAWDVLVLNSTSSSRGDRLASAVRGVQGRPYNHAFVVPLVLFSIPRPSASTP